MLPCVPKHRHGSTKTISWGPLVSYCEPLTSWGAAVPSPHWGGARRRHRLPLHVSRDLLLLPQGELPLLPASPLSTRRALWCLVSYHDHLQASSCLLLWPLGPGVELWALACVVFASASHGSSGSAVPK